MSCRQPPQPQEPATVVLAVGLTDSGGAATVNGTATTDRPPGSPALARALYACQQRRFTVIDPETVEFPSSPLDAAMVDCVAEEVGFPFEAIVIDIRGGELLARPVRQRK